MRASMVLLIIRQGRLAKEIKMTQEMAKKTVNSIFQNGNFESNEYSYMGVRFDSREMKVGDLVGNSKDNFNRDDSRDFPEYGSPEYDDLDELNGACCYDCEVWEEMINIEKSYIEHVYVIAGNETEYGEDRGELIIPRAKVIAILK